MRQRTKGSFCRGASPEAPKDLAHEAQRGMSGKRKEQGRTQAAHPHSSSSPDCGARVGSHRCPILRVRHFKYSVSKQPTEKPIDFCDGVDSPPCGVRILAAPCRARCVPLTWLLAVRRVRDYGAARSAQDDRTDYVSVGRIGPSADAPYGPRASTKGRVEARSHVEKIDRTDLAEEDRNMRNELNAR